MSGSAWSNQIVSRVIIAGANGQELVYDQAPPVFGHLIASILGANFTDPYGDLGLAGITGYGNISTPSIHYLAIQIINNGIYISTSVTEAGPWTQIARFVFTEPASAAAATTGLLLSNDNSAAALRLSSFNNAAGKGQIIPIGSVLVARDPSATTAAESWHNVTPFLNGWVAGSAQPRYRLMPDNTVMMDGTINGNAATAATFFTMPAVYRPDPTTIGTRIWPAGCSAGVLTGQSPFITINGTTGSIATGGLTPGTAGQSVTISGFYALD